MIKLVTLLAVIAVVFVLIIIKRDPDTLISATVDTPSPQRILQEPITLGVATSSSLAASSKIFTDDKLGFRIKYQDGIVVKRNLDGSVTFSKDDLNISISQESLLSKDTVNTIAERDINWKMEKLGDQFVLAESISPVAIGLDTGVTYSSEEKGEQVTYYYIPQGFHYLLVINKTPQKEGSNLFSLSDDIIYSLEIIEN
ncbi:MAG: hypothetical protein UW68_C0001G0042 [Candidatus Collierbacteria bacterium GW2011_GWB1_44_6]|uniref:Uncharacterized protein n=2 Tax=Candidatus Collieribacteriota TaxID=1752725 RepID=A0A0G1JQN5_9BACT|nr:MAG: hypothetical protein UV68_C0001G0014 [Candidatus Collierbacteria bacterium GW2011_GWC2_43_12]KKT73846.1 MAG: hypothetical protein UW68_C0001G0042 [Candidatus Collierbacteria bacterium GW2011_GWB1_44_6]KKT84134.1 MAG: hypothetical protein UW80_C0001G0014 [Microgenomates group bacterium GW2011_GWC1_44_9]